MSQHLRWTVARRQYSTRHNNSEDRRCSRPVKTTNLMTTTDIRYFIILLIRPVQGFPDLIKIHVRVSLFIFRTLLYGFFIQLMQLSDAVSSVLIVRLSQIRWLICFLNWAHSLSQSIAQSSRHQQIIRPSLNIPEACNSCRNELPFFTPSDLKNRITDRCSLEHSINGTPILKCHSIVTT